MTLTQDNFRDSRAVTVLKCVSGFFLTGRLDNAGKPKPVVPGEIIALPRGAAADVLHGNKAMLYQGPLQPGQIEPQPEVEQNDDQIRLEIEKLQAKLKPTAAAAPAAQIPAGDAGKQKTPGK
jgi:hypothetical protein